jgi:hypothetical protein
LLGLRDTGRFHVGSFEVIRAWPPTLPRAANWLSGGFGGGILRGVGLALALLLPLLSGVERYDAAAAEHDALGTTALFEQGVKKVFFDAVGFAKFMHSHRERGHAHALRLGLGARLLFGGAPACLPWKWWVCALFFSGR